MMKYINSFQERVVSLERETDPTKDRMNTTLAHAEEGQRARIRKNTVMTPQQNICTNMSVPSASANVSKSHMSVDPVIVWKYVDAKQERWMPARE